MGTQSPNYTDEREETLIVGDEDHGRKLLMFHGIILRSQLIELLKNKVFFNENEGVSMHAAKLWTILGLNVWFCMKFLSATES